MDREIHVDLARPQASADRAVGATSGSFGVNSDPSRLQPGSQKQDENTTRSSRGASIATASLKWGLSPSRSRSTSPASHDTSIEMGHPNGSARVFNLQPQDMGFGAWSYVASAFAFYIVVWGFPQAFPIFQTYLSSGHDARFPDSSILPLLAPGLQDIEEGILSPFFPKSPKYRRPIIMIGIIIMVLALILASFADTATEIVIFQGILFGIGGILLNFVHISVFSEWFIHKKGQAMGIIWCGWRVGALAFPPICQWLLQKHGYEQTMRVLIAPMLALLAPSIILLRGRYPHAAVSSKVPTNAVTKWKALRTPNVLFYLFTDVLFTLVVNVPMMFITKYGHDLGLSGSVQALSLSLLVLSNMLGTYCFSWLSDKVFHQKLTSTCAIAVGLTHFLLLGFAKSKAAVLAYVLLVGIPIGGFRNCLFAFFAEVSNQNIELFTAIHGLFSLFEGVCVLSVGPVGQLLLQSRPAVVIEQYALHKYSNLVLYAGSMTSASGLLILGRLYLQSRSLEQKSNTSI